MLFNNIDNREGIQILDLQVMQQGTRANLCKLWYGGMEFCCLSYGVLMANYCSKINKLHINFLFFPKVLMI